MYALFFVFCLTFCCFPGVIYATDLRIFRNLKNEESWFELFMQFLFNVSDAIGRWMAG